MNIQEFCNKANTDPLIRGKFVAVTPNLLTRLGFIKKDYKGKADIFVLYNILNAHDELKLTQELILTKKEEKALDALLKVLYPEIILRKNKKRTHFSLLTILRLIPEVEKMINGIRLKNKIVPEDIRRDLRQMFPDKKEVVDWFIESQREHNEAEFQGAYARLSQEKKAKIGRRAAASACQREDVWKGIRVYVAEHFPGLRKEVNNFRISLKLPEGYTEILIEYILYYRVSAYDVAINKSSSRLPSISKIDSPKDAFAIALSNDVSHFEPHILIKIYGDTSRGDANKALNSVYSGTAASIKTLPAYNYRSAITNSKNTEWSLVRNAICYFLKRQCNLEPKEIQNILKACNRKIALNTISRDIRAFERLFKVNPSIGIEF